MLSQRLGLPSAAGVIVTFVHPEGPAARAGLQTKDLVLQADGEPIADGSAWSEWVSEQAPGTRLELVVRRMGEELNLQLTIEELPAGVEPGRS
jgi:serine protease Do